MGHRASLDGCENSHLPGILTPELQPVMSRLIKHYCDEVKEDKRGGACRPFG